MNKKQEEFLLKYAKIGILSSKGNMDEIEYEEVKEEYINTKKELSNVNEEPVYPVVDTPDTIKADEKEKGSVGKWFKGIAGRQKKYQEKTKGKIM